MTSRAASAARMLFGRSTLANLSSACGSGCRVGLLVKVIVIVSASEQASGLHLNTRTVPAAFFCPSQRSGSGALVVTRTAPGFSGTGPAAGGVGFVVSGLF